MDIILSISSPSIFIVIATYILYEGLREKDKVHWKKMVLALILLIFACISLIISIAAGASYGIIFIFFIAAIAALLSGIFLGSYLTSWRKLTGILVGIGFPFVMFLSIDLGLYFSPNSFIRRDGEAIARALNEYHVEKGIYPKTLEELVPTHLADLKDPGTMWGWLYVAEEDDFTLGYVFYIDSLGYVICKYSAAIPEWDCIHDLSTGFRSTEPFYLEPTPTPEPFKQ